MTARVTRIFLLLCLLSGICSAQTTYEKLVEALKQDNPERAVTLSEMLEVEGRLSFGLFYNQGLAYRNLGQNARARASFEQALLYEPRDLSTRRRLREVKERLSPEIAKHDVTYTPWWSRTEAEAVLLVAALVVLSLGLGRTIGKSISARQVIASFAGFLLLTGLVVLTNPPAPRGVLVSSTVRLLNEPSGGATGPIVPEGVLVEVFGVKGHFIEVGTREGQRGWVRDAELVLIGDEPQPRS